MNGILTQLVLRRQGLIVGPHGSGKTTLLHTLRPRLTQQFGDVVSVVLSACPTNKPFDRIRHARRSAAVIAEHQRDLPPDGLLVVDGLEQLTLPSRIRMWVRARRRRQFVLATSHHHAIGFSTLIETKISVPLVRSLTQSLISDCGRDVRELIDRELGRHDLSAPTNLRDLWFDFYDLVAAMDVDSGDACSQPLRWPTIAEGRPQWPIA